MTDEEIRARDHDAADRGEKAERLLEELKPYLDALRTGVSIEMTQTPITQPDKVLKLHMGLSNLAAIETAIGHMIRHGRDAKTALAMADLTRP